MEFRIEGTDTNLLAGLHEFERMSVAQGLEELQRRPLADSSSCESCCFTSVSGIGDSGIKRLGVSALRIYLLLALTKFSASMFELSLPLCDHCQRHLLFASET